MFITIREQAVKVLSKAVVDLLHKCEPNQRIMMFAMPSRIVRVVAADESLKTFRVEQLVITNSNPHDPRGTWTTLSTHSGPKEGAAYHDAVKACVAAQDQLRRKMQEQQPKLIVPANYARPK